MGATLVEDGGGGALSGGGGDGQVKVGKGREEEDGGNVTCKEHRVILPRCAAYQT
jgi:hypothetical protein